MSDGREVCTRCRDAIVNGDDGLCAGCRPGQSVDQLRGEVVDRSRAPAVASRPPAGEILDMVHHAHEPSSPAGGRGGWEVSPRVAALLALAAGPGTAQAILGRLRAVGAPLPPSSLYATLGRLREEGLAARDADPARCGLRGGGRRVSATWSLAPAGVPAAGDAAGWLGRLLRLADSVLAGWVVRHVSDRALYLAGPGADRWGSRAEACVMERADARRVRAGLSGGGVLVRVRRR